MANKPILFNTEMVRAILDGRKTQTRRIAKNIPPETHRIEQINEYEFEAYWGGYMPDIEAFVDGSTTIKPRYQVGDILWVRETWRVCPSGIYCYKAIGDCDTCSSTGENTFNIKWRPSIFMPREAARIFLRVTNVRVERVQEITEKDAKAEGVITNDAVKVSSYVYWFEMLWDDLNKKRGYGWNTNLWVWVYEFERVEKP